ncbi:ribonuclease III domain-containing protein [Multifurca ochricompacta]|uniref:Ribonuclease III domain-containing protein n=1 Tax=Multifurca ochricompacta TaxID=376703 RepID=A0AAD4LXF9_9AGAM|nr:ribonuclease III domain-containing protein [Multifurca ochricompacta]
MEPYSPPSTPPHGVVIFNSFPPLPEIHSRELYTRIFTHSSLTSGPRDDFEVIPDDPNPDNEEFSHIGDQVVSLAVTDLIQDLYPNLHVGPCSKLRDRLKHGGTLAEIAAMYGLPEYLDLPAAQARHLRTSQSVKVDVFKAYVGGLYREQGIQVVKKWLIPLFTPRVEHAYQSLRADYLLPPDATPRTTPRPGSQPPSPSPSSDPPQSPPLFRSGGFMGEGDRRQGGQRGQSQSTTTRRGSEQGFMVVCARSQANDGSGSRHRRQGASSRDGKIRDAGKASLGHHRSGLVSLNLYYIVRGGGDF